ncbi:hypothetical protein GCM10023189_25190 [Nibrella saemangeumensis]|uniref:Uncharacterized protein n=1 Tax=Nibrella saemangeumensis TaxID=1084526 RepID=A0ABP8MY52_9BACT
MMSITQIIDLVQRADTAPDKSRPAPGTPTAKNMSYDDEDGAVMRAIAEAARLYKEKGSSQQSPTGEA